MSMLSENNFNRVFRNINLIKSLGVLLKRWLSLVLGHPRVDPTMPRGAGRDGEGHAAGQEHRHQPRKAPGEHLIAKSSIQIQPERLKAQFDWVEFKLPENIKHRIA